MNMIIILMWSKKMSNERDVEKSVDKIPKNWRKFIKEHISCQRPTCYIKGKLLAKKPIIFSAIYLICNMYIVSRFCFQRICIKYVTI